MCILKKINVHEYAPALFYFRFSNVCVFSKNISVTENLRTFQQVHFYVQLFVHPVFLILPLIRAVLMIQTLIPCLSRPVFVNAYLRMYSGS